MAKRTSLASKGNAFAAVERAEWKKLQQDTVRYALRRVQVAIEKQLAADAKKSGTAPTEGLRQRAKEEAALWRDACSRLFAGRDQESGALQAADDLARETARTIREAIDFFLQRAEEAPAWPLIGTFPELMQFARNRPVEMTVGWYHTHPPQAPDNMTAVDLVLAQLSLTLAGGVGRCRVCDARLAGENCEACGAKAPFSTGAGVCRAVHEAVDAHGRVVLDKDGRVVHRTCNATLASDGACPECGAGPRSTVWWRGKSRPRDLALVFILGDQVKPAEWRAWSADGAIPKSVHETVTARFRTRLKEQRKALRTYRRRIVSG